MNLIESVMVVYALMCGIPATLFVVYYDHEGNTLGLIVRVYFFIVATSSGAIFFQVLFF